MKDWKILDLNKENAIRISEETGLPILISMLLDIRGVTEYDEIYEFLSDDAELSDPFLMIDMDKAVIRIRTAVENGEKICIYGDYDADGVTSTALLHLYLESIGANVIYYIPSREHEGYGLNIPAIDKIKEYDVTLIITVDNGVSAKQEIDYANTLGIDTVVTDHHRPPEELPNAKAIVDPHRNDCESPFKELAGVGVVFKLIMALEDDNLDMDSLYEKYSDIAALGTIGDVVSLTGENRVIVKKGLSSIFNARRLGVKSLLSNSGIKGNKLTASKISFTLVPRINAGGRLGLSEKSVKLLLTDNLDEAQQIAEELGTDNKERQIIEKKIVNDILESLTINTTTLTEPIIVISGENWHQGVIGIVAARIKEIYGKPTIVISYNENGATASGRSIKGFSLIDAVTHCKELLTHYGGHPMAAGLSLKTEDIPLFTKMINNYAKQLEYIPFNTLEIDCKLNPKHLSVDLAKQVSRLEPFGSGNPTPLFGLYNMTLKKISPIGGDKHLRLTFSRDDKQIDTLLFGKSSFDFPYEIGEILDLSVTIDVNEYNMQESLSIIIKEMKLHNLDMHKLLLSKRAFDEFISDGKISRLEQKEDLFPVRDDFVKVFKFIKQNNGWHFTADVLCGKINDNNISYGKLMTILTAMKELSIIELEEKSGVLSISINPTKGKVDLQQAEIISKMKII